LIVNIYLEAPECSSEPIALDGPVTMRYHLMKTVVTPNSYINMLSSECLP